MLEYRQFGKLAWKVSALGFGVMRLPTIRGDPAKIDEPEAISMIRYAIDHGVNYVDTAYPYHQGNSETLLGKALQDGYRRKTKVATKMPTWLVKSQEDMDKYLNEQLTKLQTNNIDFYLLHGLNKERWRKLLKLNVLDWLEEKVEEGKIMHIGFSFHDKYEIFKEIIDSYGKWALCQILYNYMDEHYQAGTRGLKYAASKGIAVVVMEPIAGGRLATNPPKKVLDVVDSVKIRRTLAEWALHWVWNHDEVSVVLSGMSTKQQVMENVKGAGQSRPDTITKEELRIIDMIRQAYKQYGFINCTGCRYCIPCPEGVDIPAIFSLYNEYYMKERSGAVRTEYHGQLLPENRASRCVKCGKCEELCPQKLPIRDTLNKAAMIFEQETA